MNIVLFSLTFYSVLLIEFGQCGGDWHGHKKRFSLLFGNSKDESKSENVWRANLDAFNKHNQEYAQGVHTYKRAANKFTHLSRDEFLAKYTGYKKSVIKPEEKITNAGITPLVKPRGELPASVDWRTTNLTGPVKSQGVCGYNN
jgi:hypothetical protein